MRVTRWTKFLAAAALATAPFGAHHASAALLLSDNFDTYADQAAFVAAWPVVGTQPSGALSSAQSASAPNSVLIGMGTATADSPRNGRSFAETGNPSPGNLVVFSLDYFDANGTGNPHRNHANLQDGAAPGNGGLIGLGLNNNLTVAHDGGANNYMGRILGLSPTFLPPSSGTNPATSNGAYFKLNDPGAPVRSLGWHNLKVVISDLDFKFYVDNILSKTILQSSLAAATPLRSYDLVRLGAGFTSAQIAHYDNVRVETIPEPAALGLLGMAGLALVALRRRSG